MASGSDYPLAFDLPFPARCVRVWRVPARTPLTPVNALLWPVTVAATQFPQASVGQVHVDVHHKVAAEGLELSAVLGQLVGSLFQEMELCASHWQRIRGSQATPVWGNAGDGRPDGQPIDPQPMLDSFLLGSKSLEEVWRLMLPPNALLELRRLDASGSRSVPHARRVCGRASSTISRWPGACAPSAACMCSARLPRSISAGLHRTFARFPASATPPAEQRLETVCPGLGRKEAVSAVAVEMAGSLQSLKAVERRRPYVAAGGTVASLVDGPGGEQDRHAAPRHSRLHRRLPVFSPHRVAGLAARHAASSPRLHFDERMGGGASAIAEWSPRATPSLLVGRIVFWCFVFAGVVVGVSALGTSEHIVSGWMLGYVPRLVARRSCCWPAMCWRASWPAACSSPASISI